MSCQLPLERCEGTHKQDGYSKVAGGGHGARDDRLGGMVSPHRVDGDRQRRIAPRSCCAHGFTAGYLVSAFSILMTSRPAYWPQVGQAR